MQPNLSNHERLASIVVGSVAFLDGFSRQKPTFANLQKAGGLVMVLRGVVGYCPLFRAFHRKPLHAPHDINRSTIIDRPLEDVRSMLDEGDPMLHESSRKIFPITAGYLLWNLELESIGDGRMTEVRASLSEKNESLELKTYLSKSDLRSLADTELNRIKELLESGAHS